uniref:methyl-CpG-binding domain protein 2 n=1 Tax=Ciona intestinalis TaxID=7719 RepID=UPI000180CFEC|nr:methyl-CpG-binding domain protein 2 [Ciona intestinalis]|eukprot:XP_002132141.1 methyl-CpG-binding domain protein 2 [Ciona intestinalis]
MNQAKKKVAVLGLPHGWIREECVRQNGLSRGKCDVYYISPTGKKVRSKPELIRVLGSSVDLTCFDYRLGRFMSEKVKSSRRQKQYDKSGRLDLDTSLPARQTASIFKQSVTKVCNHKVNPMKSEQARGNSKAPQQLFKEKRLTGLSASDIAETVIETLELPKALQAIGPCPTAEELLRRIAIQLHDGNHTIVGQNSTSVLKDPCVLLNTQQPLCKSFMVTEEDIRKQENRVIVARERLEQALKRDDELQRQELLLLA